MYLLFTMQLENADNISKGRLVLIDEQQGILGRWVATSGLPNDQEVGDWSKPQGGEIPPTYQLESELPFYQVETKPVDLRSLKGVEGNAYPILPNQVITKDGVSRSDLMIHRDANVPGSLGCIVLEGVEEFADFETTLAKYAKEDTIKLLVVYTY